MSVQYKGKVICNYLREIRVRMAKEHGIDYVPAECHYEGDCAGTCPVCDAEVKMIDATIRKKLDLPEISNDNLQKRITYSVELGKFVCED